MSAHTPGPWTVQWPAKDFEDVFVVGGGNTLAEAFGRDLPERKQNALLIAAAPDLLAACEAAVARLAVTDNGRCACCGYPGECLDRCQASQLRAAIAKARGQ